MTTTYLAQVTDQDEMDDFIFKAEEAAEHEGTRRIHVKCNMAQGFLFCYVEVAFRSLESKKRFERYLKPSSIKEVR